MRPSLIGRASVVALVGLTPLSCVLDPGRSTEQLDQARAAWISKGIDSYQIVVQRICYCLTIDPVRVTVTNGQVVSRVYTTTGQPIPDNQAQYYPDVPGLFDWVEDAYDRAATVNVTFDAQYGFPVSAVVDWIKNAIDDEVTLKTSGFLTS